MNSKSDRKIFMKKGRRRKSQDRNHLSKTTSPIKSPAKFFQEQGGVEGILQEAARGLYSRGEKWGVAKALRDAVQGLQTGSTSPRISTDGSRRLIEDGKIASDASSHLTARIRALEQRNQALAKMLQRAVEDLWAQQKSLYEESRSAADTLSLAVAKVQFVQVYLENSSMPFPAEHATSEETTTSTASASAAQGETGKEAEERPRSVPEMSEGRPSHPADDQKANAAFSQNISKLHSDKNVSIRTQSADANLKGTRDHPKTDQPSPSSFHNPRPSLTHSSFSWMLGEDKRQSSFVSASPFPSEKRMARGKAGFLFGDDKDDGSKHSGKPKGQQNESCEDEIITLDYLSGHADTAN